MDWRQARRSFYYQDAPDPVAPPLNPATTALLVVDVQNHFLKRPDPATLNESERKRYDAWEPFHERMRQTVIPNISSLLGEMRKRGVECIHVRIAALTRDGRDRSLSQKLPGFNNLLLPFDEHASQIVAELTPAEGEIVVTKTTESCLTGTNLRLMLNNIGIRTVICVGILTDQCLSSTVRSLSDESFHVILVEDCAAAGSHDLHERELEILNMIYCNVMSSAELVFLMDEQAAIHA
ncbi:cysteine hydrolase family protein [Chelatococcus asaccharovorans]|uniref:Nicotinamidase-related amidase n=1 Tax=Chelatococcus asaccharovorans TaxID=28210 RepID=A0A2V3U045_9HYPH|nr:cysteine hydrolase family protein [Chelatococcus asaccharovorans]MBS7707700.1 cysteine hydrolase family protein [Chelatococcus asaccharovorans]PXW55276.1 nicotinamidase-related amidase [Chelatococcus asaccharovorans]